MIGTRVALRANPPRGWVQNGGSAALGDVAA